MSYFVENLPFHLIIAHVIPFIQYKPLLSDIVSFITTKDTIKKIYYDKYKDLLEDEKNADVYWCVSDILLFINRYRSAYIKVLYRNYNNFMSSNTNIHYVFNIFWAELTVEERNLFMKVRKPKYINKNV